MVKLGEADRLAKYYIGQLGKQFNSKSSKDGLSRLLITTFIHKYILFKLI